MDVHFDKAGQLDFCRLGNVQQNFRVIASFLMQNNVSEDVLEIVDYDFLAPLRPEQLAELLKDDLRDVVALVLDQTGNQIFLRGSVRRESREKKVA